MGKLSTASGTISLNDLRTHFGDTNSISLGDFRSGGDKVVSALSSYSYTGAKYVNTSTEQTYWRVKTTQTSTGSNGSGTVTTSTAVYVHTGGIGGELGSYTSTSDYGNSLHRGKYPIGNPQGHVERGSLVSAGSYSAWQDTLGFKDVFLNSTRAKNDYYYIIFYEPNTRMQVTSNVNAGVPLSGSIGIDDLYQIDNGTIWRGTINAGDSGNANNGRGYRTATSYSTTAYGSLSTSGIVPDIEGILQAQVTNGISLSAVYQTYANSSVLPIQVELEGTLRTTAAGTISNTSTSNISRSRFGNAFNHTGFGYTDTTAVWTRPDDINSYNNYDRRNVNWSSTSANGTRRDDGHAGWLLPTAGPTLLQVRAENENGSPVINSVRFTPNSFWQGKTVAIQALRTRNTGGISNFTCSGAASGDFSSLSNGNGAPITRYVTLPSSGYITLSASGTGSYSGTNRIIQISVFDPYQWGNAKDRLVIRQVYVNGSLVGDTTTDSYINNIATNNASGTGQMVNMVRFLDTGVTVPSSGTFTLELRR
jgi:hypothetical protein